MSYLSLSWRINAAPTFPYEGSAKIRFHWASRTSITISRQIHCAAVAWLTGKRSFERFRLREPRQRSSLPLDWG
jgi:hypothetical protein